jgi:Domain of unknown function (DUF1707)
VADHDAGEQPPVPPLRDGAGVPVTDDDRNRYGMLLDKAADRGLLTTAQYEVRLRDLASAATTEEMLAIVTDLPAFTAVPGATASAGRRGRMAPGPSAGHPLTGGPGSLGTRRRQPRTSAWLVLVVLVVVVAVALVVLGLAAARLHRPAPTGSPRPVAARVVLSGLRL